MQFSKHLPAIIFFALATCFLGCSEKNALESTADAKADTNTVEATPTPIPFENLDDPTFYSEPRWHFADSYPGPKDWAFFSSKLDGSDLRIAATRDVIFGGLGSTGGAHARSPNGRYVAQIIDSDTDGTGLYLLDLKTKSHVKMKKGRGKASFNWASDSKSVIFHADQDIWRYWVDTGELTELSDEIEARDFFLLPDDETLLVIVELGYKLHSVATGKELKYFYLKPFSEDTDIKKWYVSPDGKQLAFRQWIRNEFYIQLVDIQSGKILSTVAEKELPATKERVAFWFSTRENIIQYDDRRRIKDLGISFKVRIDYDLIAKKEVSRKKIGEIHGLEQRIRYGGNNGARSGNIFNYTAPSTSKDN